MIQTTALCVNTHFLRLNWNMKGCLDYYYHVDYPDMQMCMVMCCYKYIKHFQKMYRDVGMVVPKTTETRCRDGSVQARHVIQRLHMQLTPFLHFFVS